MKHMNIKGLFVGLLFTSSSLFAQDDWAPVRKYNHTMSYSKARETYQLLSQPCSSSYVTNHVQMDEKSLKMLSPSGQVEAEIFFGDAVAPQDARSFSYNGNDLRGLKVGLSSRLDDKSAQAIELRLKDLLEQKGATVFIRDRGDLAAVNTLFNNESVHLALSLQALGDNFLAFSPGSFMDGELKETRFRVRFAHCLVSGKATNSAELGRFTAKSWHAHTMNPSEANNAIVLIPTSLFPSFANDGAMLKNVAARNLFINGAFVPLVLHLFLPSSVEHAHAASNLLKGIEDYLTTHPEIN